MAVINRLPHPAGGGSGPAPETETLLWQNANPTSNLAAGSREFLTPLSSDLVPLYRKLKIVYKRTATGTAVYEVTFVLPSSLDNYKKDANLASFAFGFETSSYYSCRYIQFVDDTTWYISTGYRNNNTSGITSHNVVTEIYGIR